MSFHIDKNTVSNVDFGKVEQTKSTEPQAPIGKIPTAETAKTQQASKPETPRASAKEVALNAVGKGLIGFGLVAGVVLSPVAVPGGLLGAAVGAGIGKGIGALTGPRSRGADSPAMIGAQVGASIGSLATFGFIRLGAHLLHQAKEMKSDRKLPSANAEKANQLEKAQDQLEKLTAFNKVMADTEALKSTSEDEKAVADPVLRQRETRVESNQPNPSDVLARNTLEENINVLTQSIKDTKESYFDIKKEIGQLPPLIRMPKNDTERAQNKKNQKKLENLKVQAQELAEKRISLENEKASKMKMLESKNFTAGPTKEVPDPDGIKYVMDQTRVSAERVSQEGGMAMNLQTKNGSGQLMTRYNTDLETFDINLKPFDTIENRGKYGAFVEAFNEELQLRKNIGRTRGELENAETNGSPTQVLEEKLELELSMLQDLMKASDAAYEKAVSDK